MSAMHRATDRNKAKSGANKARRRGHQRRIQAFSWLGAGAVSLGIGAVLASGSAVASADTAHTGTGTASTGSSHNISSARASGSAAGSISGGSRTATGTATGTRSNDSAPTTAGITPRSLVVASRAASANPITVNPTLTFNDAIVLGNTNAIDAKGLPLSYTVASAPNQGGKVRVFRPIDVPSQPAGAFTYLPDTTVLTGATEQFSILVSETTPFDAALKKALKKLPALESLATSIINDLHQVPILSTLLAPIIGHAVVVPFSSAEVPQLTEDIPVAFTDKVISFDGTLISTNFYPAAGLTTGESAPTIIGAPGIGSPGNTNPLGEFLGSTNTIIPGIKALRGAGYNVVTFDPRGEFDSGGVLQANNPFYEGRDVSAIITWILTRPETETNQRIGMVGNSYGGSIQLVTAANDPRIDAIVPSITYNSFLSSWYPSDRFRSAYSAVLLQTFVLTRARINTELYTGILTGILTGVLPQSFQAFLGNSGPTILVNDITVPTLLIQGTDDNLFPLQQSIDNAIPLSANGVPIKMVWFCGGHNVCLNPGGGNEAVIFNDTLAWLDQYVKEVGTPADSIPTFDWQDQTGQSYTSPYLPSDPAFYGTPITDSGAGGILPIISLLGGSGPVPESGFRWLANGSPARIAVNVPLDLPATPTQIVGAPTLSFTYSGIGTSRTVYAQIVDETTGRVLGLTVTPIPVTLNGQPQTVTVELNDITFTTNGDPLVLQIVGAATPFASLAQFLTSFGVVNVSNVRVSLPTAADAEPA